METKKTPSVDRLFSLINSLDIPSTKRDELIKELSAILDYYNDVLSFASSTIESVLNKVTSSKEDNI